MSKSPRIGGFRGQMRKSYSCFLDFNCCWIQFQSCPPEKRCSVRAATRTHSPKRDRIFHSLQPSHYKS
ncbi:hypothetical protein [Moorena sp. SIO4G3]|uniref:hypothetical protein n=1 Tax=Moorena sp. SIO4G3 TaxID=2607821 RepID=UPI0025D97AF0|nr:hypothetical protein [Moorena sp. SIO4G3]